MSSNHFISSHKLYKSNTEAVILHLTKTAEEFHIEIPKRAPTAPNPTTTSDSTAYSVAVKDIVPLARLVMAASQRPTPAIVLRILGRVISSRKMFTDWYKSQSIHDPSLEASNRGHDHFNSVLDKLLEVLNLYSVEASSQQVGDAKSTLESETVSQSPLGDLELESLSQEASSELPNPDDETSASDNGHITGSQSQEVPSPTIYEVADPVEDLQFTIFNMTKDLHVLRQHIHGLLERYVVRNISLLSLSAVVITAIGAVRRIEKDLLKSLSEYSSWEKVMEAVVSPAQFEAVSTGLFDELVTSSQRDFLDSVYCMPFGELRHFRDSIVRHQLPRYLNGRVLISRLEASQIDKVDGWAPGKIILNEFFREVLSLLSRKLPAEDELTRGIVEVFRKGPIHLWVVFGLQLFLDTQQILGEHVTRAFRELKATGNVLRHKVNRQIQLTQVIMKRKYTEEELENLRSTRLSLVDTWISKDEFLRQRRMQPPLGPGRPYFFFSHNPVACGLFQFALLLTSQRAGMLDLNGSAYALAVAHLYNAAQNENLLTTNWPDMEKLIEFFGKEDLFIGGPPKTVEQYLSQYLMVKGVASQHFATNRRFKGIIFADDGPRRLNTSEFVENFEKLLCKTGEGQTDINVDLIETFLHKMAHTQSMNKKKQGHIDQRSERSNTLTPIQLLKLLEQCMEEEEPKLGLDYYVLYESSWHLLASIETELGPEFKDWLSLRFPEHDSSNTNRCLHYLPHYVFEKLEKASKSGKAVATEENILARVARVIDGAVLRTAKDPSPTVIGGVNDDDLVTEFKHGTQNGLCIHWGRCKETGIYEGQGQK